MNEPIRVTSEDSPDGFELGEMLGQRRAFGAVAGRCSAADAECMRRIRESKRYLQRSPSWVEFCPRYLGMSRQHADRIIRTLEQLGPEYFELAQLTRITPDQFRAIAPSIHDRAVHLRGEAIALIPENSGRLAVAVSELRHDAEPVEAPGTARAAARERCDAAARLFDKAAGEFAALVEDARDADNIYLLAALQQAQSVLKRIRADAAIAGGR